MRKKSRQICGRKTTVPETPPISPPTRRSRTAPAGMRASRKPPRFEKIASIRSIGMLAHGEDHPEERRHHQVEDDQPDDRMGEGLVEAIEQRVAGAPHRVRAADALADDRLRPKLELQSAETGARRSVRRSCRCAAHTSARVTASSWSIALAAAGGDRHHRRADRPGHLLEVEGETAAVGEIDHVEGDDERHRLARELAHQHEVPREVGRIGDHDRGRRRAPSWPASASTATVDSG